jgi:Arc/MetJ-type ribon-helix-helix transcriptional regulator
MSGAVTNDDEDEVVTVNFKLTQSFLDTIDEAWQGRGFNSRSEYIRYVLRDATENPTFDRDELIALLRAEDEFREDETTDAADARERFGHDTDG